MSHLHWPYIATNSKGEFLTPEEAKYQNDEKFTIGGIEVKPRVGAINQPHWYSLSKTNYSHIRQGYEMSEWHWNQQVAAHILGMEIEYKISCEDGRTLFADAFDKHTNTIIEYVWSHYDPIKIDQYFDMGFNQRWIFAEEKVNKLKYFFADVDNLDWQKSESDISKQMFNVSLPTIEAYYV